MSQVLIACEYSARVRDAFRAAGHDARSVDLLPSEGDETWHYQDDVFAVVGEREWDLMIAFPPCTYLTNAGARWWPQTVAQREQALTFVRDLMALPVDRIAIENPAGAIGTQIRKADQYVQPWWFGEPFQKTTGLWLKNLPLLVPKVTEKPVDLRAYVDNRARTEGSLAGTGGVRKSKDRSRTFLGIAQAMADQWGPLIS